MRWTRTDGLGKAIVVYERYRRVEIAAKLVVCGSGAAVAGWLARLLDETIWMLAPGLVALGLFMLSLNLFFRFIDPGKRLAVYENGLSVGWSAIQWEDLDYVSFEHTRRTEKNTRASHEELEITFHLHSGKKRVLPMSDETLPFHVNVVQFVGLLTELGVHVEDELAPQVRREDSSRPRSGRNPELLAELRAEFEAVFAEPDEAGALSELLEAFGRGSRVRWRLSAGHLVSFCSAKLLSWALWLGFAALLITMLFLVIFLIIEVLALFGHQAGPEDTLGGLGVPSGWLRIPPLAIALVGMWWLGLRAHEASEVFAASSRRRGARFAATRRHRKVTREAFESPFALYLRSFAGEYYTYRQTTSETGTDGLATKYERLERDLDRKVISATRDRLPLYALANAHDASASTELQAVFVPTEDWLLVVAVLMRRSAAVILHLSVPTESVLAELWALDALEARGRSFVVVGSELDSDELDQEELRLLEQFAYQAREDAPDLHTRLAHFVESVAADSA